MPFQLYEQLPTQGGTPVLLTEEQFENKFSCIYQAGTAIPRHHQQELQKTMQAVPTRLGFLNNPDVITQQTQAILKKPHLDLGIVNLGPTIGYSVIALNNIPANQVVAIYSGRVVRGDQLSDAELIYSFDYHQGWVVCALQSGSIARFFPHLPTDYFALRKNVAEQLNHIDKWVEFSKKVSPGVDDAALRNLFTYDTKNIDQITQSYIDGLTFNESREDEYRNIQFQANCPANVRKNLATANVGILPVKIANTWHLAVITSQPIKRHEIVGIDYTSKFWASNKIIPHLLLKDGTIVDQQYYKRDSLNNYFTKSLEKLFPKLCISAAVRTKIIPGTREDTYILPVNERIYENILLLFKQISFHQIQTDQDNLMVVISDTKNDASEGLKKFIENLELVATQFEKIQQKNQQKTNETFQLRNRIPFLHTLPSEGATLQYLSYTDYRKIFNCVYNENVSVVPSLEEEMRAFNPQLNDMDDHQALLTEVKDIIAHPRRDLAIVYLGKTGYGLMAIEDIKEDEVLFVYSGKVTRLSESPNDPYVHGYFGANLCVSAKDQAGLARFLPHLPADQNAKNARIRQKLRSPEMLLRIWMNQNPSLTQEACEKKLATFLAAGDEGINLLINSIMKGYEQDTTDSQELQSIQFNSDEVKSNLATSNINIDSIKSDGGKCFIVMRSARLIKKHEIVGYNYHYFNYWLSVGQQPELFLKTGEMIDRKDYQRKNRDMQPKPAYEMGTNRGSQGESMASNFNLDASALRK